jgi:hypothetical protein
VRSRLQQSRPALVQVQDEVQVQDQVQDKYFPNGVALRVGLGWALNRTQPTDDAIQLLSVDVDVDLDLVRFFSAEQAPTIATCSGPGPRPA